MNSRLSDVPLSLNLDESAEQAPRRSFSSDNDTASQQSISLSSPTGSPAAKSISLDDDDDADDHVSPLPTATAPSPHGQSTSPSAMSLIRESLSFSTTPRPPSVQQAPNRNSTAYPLSLSSDMSSDVDDDRSLFMKRFGDDEDVEDESPMTSVAPSIADKPTLSTSASTLNISPPPPPLDLGAKRMSPPTPMPKQTDVSSSSPPPPVPPIPSSISYPPPPIQQPVASPGTADAESVASFSSSYSKKARPESLLVNLPSGRLVVGLALVDFNHLVGPKIEYARGDIFQDDELVKILPFLALPDGAHLTTEDYSYFHLVPAIPNPTTIFGISCNRQIKATELIKKPADVTRSTVQKAVVVLASKPVFGPIRDRLGVITRALFAQCDFSDIGILDAFYESLEGSLKSQLTESGLYMGTSLRELVHTFRHRTLILLKALMLQKKIMFYGHPVEKLCTYQYSLVTLVPGLLQNLDDSGSPPLATRAKSLQRPTELKTSDHKSMRAFVGLPLDLFGKDAFFQPYLPLQQMDMLKDTKSWLCGSTNSIVAQQKEVDLLVNIETNTFEFRDPRLERSAGLTAADRKWMDDIVKDVNENWASGGPEGSMHFKGSDDYLREKFDEYISGALSSVKYADFIAKGNGNGVMISDGSGNPNAVNDFNMLWIAEFKKTHAYEVWDRVTDPVLFDIVEPRHPCGERPSVVSDIGLRLSEGIQDLKIDQQLAPTREAITRTFTAGSTGFLKAVEGVRGRWLQRNPSPSSSTDEVQQSTEGAASRSRQNSIASVASAAPPPPPKQPTSTAPVNGIKPLSLGGSVRSSTSSAAASSSSTSASPPEPAKTAFSSWGANIGSFFSQRASRFSTATQSSNSNPNSASRPGSVSTPPRRASPSPAPSRTTSVMSMPIDLGEDELKPKNLDHVYSGGSSNAGSSPSVGAHAPATITSTSRTGVGKDAGVGEQGKDKDKDGASMISRVSEESGTGFAL
ncbi:hypothetical protein K474DRAFT_1667802 [Panus rudis PR-1116 ss-1]|nr:hypothetical protein K474DRAFT_1667802 [Panus rudis PR-1116 ss-1]